MSRNLRAQAIRQLLHQEGFQVDTLLGGGNKKYLILEINPFHFARKSQTMRGRDGHHDAFAPEGRRLTSGYERLAYHKRHVEGASKRSFRQLARYLVDADPNARIGRSISLHQIWQEPIEEAVFVLHCFQKKSKSGIATPKADMDIIRARLKVAETIAKEMRDGNPRH